MDRLIGVNTRTPYSDATRPAGSLPLRSAVSAPSGANGLCGVYPWACAQGTSTGSVVACPRLPWPNSSSAPWASVPKPAASR